MTASLAGCSHALPSGGPPKAPTAAAIAAAAAKAAAAPAPACQGADLRGTSVGTRAATGNLYAFIDLVNTGATPCRLAGTPSLVGVSGNEERPIAINADPVAWAVTTPRDLAPGATGGLVIQTYDACAALNQPDQAAVQATATADTDASMMIVLPGHAGRLTVTGLDVDTACGVAVSPLGLRSFVNALADVGAAGGVSAARTAGGISAGRDGRDGSTGTVRPDGYHDGDERLT